MADNVNLQKVNKDLKTTNIKGKDYVEVNQRIKGFRQLFPEGSITTEIIQLENGFVLMKATVSVGDKVLGTGHAFEKEQSSYINKTSYIENCETSAVGRALGMCGIGIDTSVASAEEVSNAIAQQDAPAVSKKSAPAPKTSGSFICEKCGNPIGSHGKNGASQIAEASKKQFGLQMCFECAKQTKEENERKEREKIEEEVGLPFPIDDL